MAAIRAQVSAILSEPLAFEDQDRVLWWRRRGEMGIIFDPKSLTLPSLAVFCFGCEPTRRTCRP